VLLKEFKLRISLYIKSWVYVSIPLLVCFLELVHGTFYIMNRWQWYQILGGGNLSISKEDMVLKKVLKWFTISTRLWHVSLATFKTIHYFAVVLVYIVGISVIANNNAFIQWNTVDNDKVYQLLAHGRWFSPGTPASSTTKTGRHNIAEILLNVALNTKNQ